MIEDCIYIDNSLRDCENRDIVIWLQPTTVDIKHEIHNGRKDASVYKTNQYY